MGLHRRRQIPKALSGIARPIGRIGDVDPYGPSRTATFYIGLERGTQPQNQTPRCMRMRTPLTRSTTDNVFLTLRERQIGLENVGATRRVGRGWYRGQPEESISYQVIFVPTRREKTFRSFASNMRKLAEGMSQALCQDAVILVTDNGTQRIAQGASCPRPRSCWPQR